ncbi:post-transcriptional regulator [Paenibacillus sp. y28]|uniref:post-transcriptional regulator n=1 Tax=Paenibacillus sp. y28 TaxID=3129110 RepID=UPI00301A4628
MDDQEENLPVAAQSEQKEQPSPLSEEEMSEAVERLCVSKAEEFRLIGYEHVTGQEVWECVSDKYRKHGTPPTHRIVNDILSLKATQFMNWMTMSIYRNNN